MTVAMSTALVRGTKELGESFGEKLKKFFVRPKPTPKHRKRKKASPTPTISPSPAVTSTPAEKPVSRPTPSRPPMIKPPPSPVGKKGAIPNATISTVEILGSESYSPEVQKVIDLGLNLTTQNLGYKINSADPAGRVMDSSGFVYRVLSRCGIKDVPRGAREQYVWVRKAGTFEAVLAQRDDSFRARCAQAGRPAFLGDAIQCQS